MADSEIVLTDVLSIELAEGWRRYSSDGEEMNRSFAQIEFLYKEINLSHVVSFNTAVRYVI